MNPLTFTATAKQIVKGTDNDIIPFQSTAEGGDGKIINMIAITLKDPHVRDQIKPGVKYQVTITEAPAT